MAEPEVENLSLEENRSKTITDGASQAKSTNKIDLLVKATGDAPILKRKKWAVDPDKTVAMVVVFLKKCLEMDPADSLFLYVNQCFSPSPDQVIRNLYDCFGTDGKLILYYCKTQAWG